MLFHRRHMLFIVANGEDAAMHLGVQRLDAPIHDLGEARMVGDLGHRYARIAQSLGGAARGEQLDFLSGEEFCQLKQAGLIGNGEECAGDFHRSNYKFLACSNSGTSCFNSERASSSLRALQAAKSASKLLRRWAMSQKRGEARKMLSCEVLAVFSEK